MIEEAHFRTQMFLNRWSREDAQRRADLADVMAQIDALQQQVESAAKGIALNYQTLHTYYDSCLGVFEEEGWYAFADTFASEALLALTGMAQARALHRLSSLQRESRGILKMGEGTAINIKQPIGVTGKVGEKELKKLGGQSQKYFETSKGRRFVDQFDPKKSVGHESKVGPQSLTKDMKQQIAKDAELLATKQVKGVEWHFFQSPQTSKAGASWKLQQALQKAGIKIVWH